MTAMARNTVPRSRITLTYDTRQPDQPRKEKELPLRLLILGDLTGRALKPAPAPGDPPRAKDDLEDRKIHDLNGGNLDSVMAKMNISVELTNVTNHIDRAGEPFNMTIPISSMAAFEPGAVVQHVPATQRLLQIRKLLLDLQKYIDNNKQFRRLIRELTSPARAALLEQLRATFTKELAGQLRIPSPAEMADPPALPAPQPPPSNGAAAPPAPTPPPAAPTTPPAPAPT